MPWPVCCKASLRGKLLENVAKIDDKLKELQREQGAQGGRAAAKNMTKAERVARAKKAAAASAANRKRKKPK